MGSELLFLHEWKTSFLHRAWISLKVFLKEGLWLRQWEHVFRLSKPYGSISIPKQLIVSLKRMNLPFHEKINQSDSVQTAVVFKDIRNLEWAVRQKRKGHISRLLAGPFVATLPFEGKCILLSEEIDELIFLSEWHRDLFLAECDRRKLGRPRSTVIWFAGVDHNAWVSKQSVDRDEVLIYYKQAPTAQLEWVKEQIRERGMKYTVITYGSYDEQIYKAQLERCLFVVFLHMTETQGLASFEAWSMNRPTLHWNPGTMPFLGKEYLNASSCPYLVKDAGLDFNVWSEFPAKLDEMLKRWRSFNPRDVVVKNYSLAASAQRFKEIIQRHESAK